MLAHGEAELVALALDCELEDLPESAGWLVDRWELSDDHVDKGVAIYNAVLRGGMTGEVREMLRLAGIDAEDALAGLSRDEITRSDITELIAAASLVAGDGIDATTLHMPNVPKMSRRKSDSGIDAMAVELDPAAVGDLKSTEVLTLASVKHTVGPSTSGLRWSLEKSLSSSELSVPYVMSQLRVLNGRLQQEGLSEEAASRVYLFLRRFPDPAKIRLIAVGLADASLLADFENNAASLSSGLVAGQRFRMILLPGIANLHKKAI